MSGLSVMQRELLRLGFSDVPVDVRFDRACKFFHPDYEPETQQWLLIGSPEYRRGNVIRAAVSRSLKRLEQRGFVERFRNRHAGYTLTLDGWMEGWRLGWKPTPTVNSQHLTVAEGAS